MLSAGGHVATETLAPASASALAIAKPNPPSSATPATSARRPVRSMLSMGRNVASPEGAEEGPAVCGSACQTALAQWMSDASSPRFGVVRLPHQLAFG